MDWIGLDCKEATTNSKKLCIDGFSGTSLTELSVLLRTAMFIFTHINIQDQFSEGGVGYEHIGDLHSDLSPAMARHSLKLTGSPLHFRAFFYVLPSYHLRAPIRLRIFCPTSKQLPRRPVHRNQSNVASMLEWS